MTPEYWSIVDPEDLKKRIDKMKDINQSRFDNGMNLFHYLVEYAQDPKLMDIILSTEINVNAQDHEGRSVLHYAVQRDSDLWVQKIVNQSNIDTNLRTKRYQTTALHWAVDLQASLNKIQLIIEKGADISITSNDGTTALILASKPKNGSIQPELIQLLLSAGSNLNRKDKYGKTALSYMKENEAFIKTEFFKKIESIKGTK